jgi:predicted RNA-binding protein
MSNYWLNLFNIATWKEFLDAGGRITGFRERTWTTVQQIKPSDYLVCYLTGASRFIALLEARSAPFIDRAPIWKGEEFPCRIKVKPLVILTPMTGLPAVELKDQLSFFKDNKSPSSWANYFRRSPIRIKETDGEMIVDALFNAKEHPVSRPLDKQKIARSLKHNSGL